MRKQSMMLLWYFYNYNKVNEEAVVAQGHKRDSCEFDPHSEEFINIFISSLWHYDKNGVEFRHSTHNA